MTGTNDIGAIFDWDGVIIDSSAQHERSWELLATQEGRVLPEGHFRQGFGQKNERIIPGILRWTEEPAEIRRLSARKEALYREVVAKEGLRLLAGATELLSALHAQGIPCAVGSSTHRANLDAAFALLGIRRYFAAVVTGEDVSQGKPDPEVFLLAARRIGTAPRRCVVFEDAPAGIEAARAGGMKAVALRTTNPTHPFDEADMVAGDLSDIRVEMITALFNPDASRAVS